MPNGERVPPENGREHISTITVSINELQQIMKMAQMGEGDIVHMNDAEAARQQLLAIFNKVKDIIRGSSPDVKR